MGQGGKFLRVKFLEESNIFEADADNRKKRLSEYRLWLLVIQTQWKSERRWENKRLRIFSKFKEFGLGIANKFYIIATSGILYGCFGESICDWGPLFPWNFCEISWDHWYDPSKKDLHMFEHCARGFAIYAGFQLSCRETCPCTSKIEELPTFSDVRKLSQFLLSVIEYNYRQIQYLFVWAVRR